MHPRNDPAKSIFFCQKRLPACLSKLQGKTFVFNKTRTLLLVRPIHFSGVSLVQPDAQLCVLPMNHDCLLRCSLSTSYRKSK